MTLREYISQIKEREQKATPGPWFNNQYGRNIRNFRYEKVLGKKFHIFRYPHRTSDYPISHEEWQGNADLIAHSRTDIPNLVKIIEVAVAALQFIVEYDDNINEHFEEYHKAKEALAELERLASEVVG